LKDALQDTILSNPNHKSSDEEQKIFEEIQREVIDVDQVEVVETN